MESLTIQDSTRLDAAEVDEAINFLLRFASLIYGGENAEKLQKTAALLEKADTLLGRTETRLHDASAFGAKAHSEALSLNASLAAANEELAERRKEADELRDLRARLNSPGSTFVMVPTATLEGLRAQFTYLASQFARLGDGPSQMMCEIGACTIEATVADSLKEITAEA